MKFKFTEALPDSRYILKSGDIFLSAGNTIIYQVIEQTGPVCKLYRDIDKPGTYECWGTESSWYDTGCPKKGWRRNGPNFPSYLVKIIDPDTMETYDTSITLRWIPVKVTLTEAIDYVKSVQLKYRSSPQTKDEINLPSDTIKNMQTNVDF